MHNTIVITDLETTGLEIRLRGTPDDITRVADVARRGVAEEIAQALEEPPAMSNREITALIKADDDEDRAACVVGVALGYAAGVARRVGEIER